MHGNRDFLLGEGFARATGCTLLTDPTVIELGGEPTLLMHGDTLCTDDTEYQQFRALVRNPAWQQQFLARPITERRAIAANLRETSRQRTGDKAAYIMDVNSRAVDAALRAHGVQRLIHGHTHRPAVHALDIDGQPAQRIVLGDWYEQGSVLRCDADGLHLETLPLG
jgi:UDP-2,3-diacylglucosamine hydrolase